MILTVKMWLVTMNRMYLINAMTTKIFHFNHKLNDRVRPQVSTVPAPQEGAMIATFAQKNWVVCSNCKTNFNPVYSQKLCHHKC